MTVKITDEMKAHAKIEAGKRDPHIHHHFDVNHLTGEERDIIGFLGEFALCELLGIDWKGNIREDYLTIDNFDISHKNKLIDVKTETIPEAYISSIISHTIIDDDLYGRRLIHSGQVSLLSKYDIVLFGAFKRGDYSEWHPLGYLESSYILKNYSVTNKRPDGGFYPFSALPIKTSELKRIGDLL